MTDDLYNPLLSPNIDGHIDYYIKCRNTTYDDTYNSAWLDGAIVALKDYKKCMINSNIYLNGSE